MADPSLVEVVVFPAPVPSAPLAEVLDAVRALARAAGSSIESAPPSSTPQGPGERAMWLSALRQIVDTAEAAFTQVLSDFDSTGDGTVLHGAASTQAWLRGALGMSASEASERVRVARAVRGELAVAFELMTPAGDGCEPCDNESTDRPPQGAVSYEHVRSIHRTLRALPPSERERAGETLTSLAPHLGVDDLRAAGRHLRHVLDPDGSRRHAEEDFERRWLALAPLLDGMHSIDGVLDAETAGRLNAALAPFLVPTGPDDARTTDQRRADGLAEIVHSAVKSDRLPQLSGSTVAMQVDVPLCTLTGDAPLPGRLTTTTHTPVWFTPQAAQRLACDASVRRLLLDASGVPLDLGREARVFSGVQRKALAARDGGCRFPGCNRPAAHTDGHHVVAWAQGGSTDLDNGLLLCRFHHRQVHEGGWRIVPDSPGAGANGTLVFLGPGTQRLSSPVPTARGPSP